MSGTESLRRAGGTTAGLPRAVSGGTEASPRRDGTAESRRQAGGTTTEFARGVYGMVARADDPPAEVAAIEFPQDAGAAMELPRKGAANEPPPSLLRRLSGAWQLPPSARTEATPDGLSVLRALDGHLLKPTGAAIEPDLREQSLSGTTCRLGRAGVRTVALCPSVLLRT